MRPLFWYVRGMGKETPFIGVMEKLRRIISPNRDRPRVRDLMNTLDQEKGRIARILHDDIGQQLFYIKSLALLEKGEVDIRARLLEAIDSLIAANREHIQNLRPEILKATSLTELLVQLADLYQRRYALEIQLSLATNDEAELDSQSLNQIYGIFAEALFNTVKHSTSKKVLLQTFHPSSGGVVIRCADFGQRPIDFGKAGRKSLGLLAMRERADLLRGELDIQYNPTEGVVIELILKTSQEQNVRWRAYESKSDNC